MDVNLRNKVAVVTGGTAGIGLATAELFAREGAMVAICSSTQINVDKAVKAFAEKGLKVYGERVDVSSRDEMFGFADRVEQQFGGIDQNAATALSDLVGCDQRAVIDRLQIDIHGLLPDFLGRVDDLLLGHDAGVADPHINTAKLLLDPISKPEHLVPA